VKRLAAEHGAQNLVAVFGLNEPDTLRILATTLRSGDPSFAGALAGIALGIPSYHIFELRDETPPEVWRAQMAMEELELEDALRARILATMREVRGVRSSATDASG
jgi:betaine reductase